MPPMLRSWRVAARILGSTGSRDWLPGRALAGSRRARRPTTTAPSRARLSDERADGERADGERADGERADGERADGERADGERADGERADRQRRCAIRSARELLKYVVSCALADGDSVSITVDGTTYSSRARWGSRPSGASAHGSCDGAASAGSRPACWRASTPPGVEREISIRGDNHALRPTPRRAARLHRCARRPTSATCSSTGQPRFLCLVAGPDRRRARLRRLAGRLPDDGRRLVRRRLRRSRGTFGAFEDCSDSGTRAAAGRRLRRKRHGLSAEVAAM